MTTIVEEHEIETVHLLGKQYLRGCKVAEWKTLDSGKWAPRAWIVPMEALEAAGEAFMIVRCGDVQIVEKLGRGYLATCQVADGEWRSRTWWLVPKAVLGLDDSKYEKQLVYLGDVKAVRMLGEVFIDGCETTSEGWIVPTFVLEQNGLTPLSKEKADGVRSNMSQGQHAANRAKYPEKVIADEWFEWACGQAEGEGYRKAVSIAYHLSCKHPENRFYLPRKLLEKVLRTDGFGISEYLDRMKSEKLIRTMPTKGRLKVFRYIGQGRP